ncbi:MAG TPA: DUF305 domain-containing protein [Longimicrobiaceae bacterium]|nr:DUF305 domain-containing protein [Longimicrobiaceae bacterium]
MTARWLPIAAFVLTGCSAGVVASPRSAPEPAPAVQADLAAVARARADSARYPYTEADIRFMTRMIGHHAQAIVMAEMAPTHDASPQISTLAARIISSQQDEIAIMQRWLGDRLQPVPRVTSAGTVEMPAGEHSMHDMHGMTMPGMLTEAELAELAGSTGREFDRLFLTYMIQHHRGAVSMVEELFGTYGAAQDELVFKFASDVNVDQTTEIARMQRMLVDVIFLSSPP